MRLFRTLYDHVLDWAGRRHAERYLATLSFIEAIIFPVPPEVMLAPMVLARPRRWLRYASVSLGFSLLGALVGYALGHFAFEAARPLLEWLGWMPRIDELVGELSVRAAGSPWMVFGLLVVAGFLPVPLKIFTWASGIVGIPLLPFIASMFVGRGKRVYLLAGLVRLGGARAERMLLRWIEWIGWSLIVLIIAAIIYLKFVH